MSNESSPTSPTSPTSLKKKLKSSLRLSCLSHNHGHHATTQLASRLPLPSPGGGPSLEANHNNHNDDNNNNNNNNKSKLMSGTLSPTWDKCRSLIIRIGHAGHGNNGHGHHHRHSHDRNNGHGHHHRRRHSADFGHHHGRRHSADFRYDPSSYALNFDDGSHELDDELPMRNFSARLPRSPPGAVATTTPREITACI